MHWNNGRFHGPVTLENNLNITDFKYNAIKYYKNNDGDNIEFSDKNVRTVIKGDTVHIKSFNGTGTFESEGDITIQSNFGNGTFS